MGERCTGLGGPGVGPGQQGQILVSTGGPGVKGVREYRLYGRTGCPLVKETHFIAITFLI